MHDIGKVGIPDSILNKNGKLDSAEWGSYENPCKNEVLQVESAT